MTGRDGRALLAVMPALAVIAACLLIPLLWTLATAVRDPELSATLPRSAVLLRAWDGHGLPGEATYAAMATELKAASETQALGPLARRMNFEQSGLRVLLMHAAEAELSPPYAASMTALDARWGERATWLRLQRASGPFTDLYLLRALDLDRTPDGTVVAVPAEQAVFRTLFLRTLEISLHVTVLCLVIGYPVAWTITVLPRFWSGVATALVLVPFWMSVLVRTTAWLILLQREGPLNDLLQALHLTDGPLQLIFTRTAVYIAMVHVLLPFVVVPLTGVMRRINPAYLQAAESLGAGAWARFQRVYFPMTLPGVAAGGLITFMMAVGFYITPALVGGPDDQLVSTWIADYINADLNWGMAAALAVGLLGMTAAVVVLARLLLPAPARPGALGPEEAGS